MIEKGKDNQNHIFKYKEYPSEVSQGKGLIKNLKNSLSNDRILNEKNKLFIFLKK